MMSCYEEGFRLVDAISECSMRSKARIDTLFEDTRSVCSSNPGGWCSATTNNPSLNIDEPAGTEEQVRANGAVQARIEAMFASVEAETGTPGKSAAAILPVKYMGAAPVGGRVASVRGLQEPLRQLLERVNESISAELEISRRGLTFRTSEISEKTNPFRRIAVWSALRLRSKASSIEEVCHAFLPLVSDDQTPCPGDEKHADLYRSMRGLTSETKDYPPIFAVVMRRPGAVRLLECHAFACKTEEDAVAAAATLYRALLADLDANRRRPRQANGLGCVSLASVASSVAEPSILGAVRSVYGGSTQHSRRISSSSVSSSSPGTPGHPVRPPRSKKNSGSQSDGRASVRSLKLEKAPKKNKKVSEIKAEDILEARSRKLPPANSRVSALKELRADEVLSRGFPAVFREETNNRDTISVDKSRNRSRNEERNNSCNKLIHPETSEEAARSNESSKNNTPLYNENNVYSCGDGRVYNNYEKLPKVSKSFDYRDNPEINYSFVERNGSVVGEVIENDRNEDCYEINQSIHCETSVHREHTSRPASRYSNVKREIPERSRSSDSRVDADIQCTSRSRDNSLYSGNDKVVAKRSVNREKMYEQRFKDADKIYSIGHEDISVSGKRRGSRSEIEDNFSFSRPATRSSCDHSKTGNNDRARKHSGNPRSSETSGRLSRINTMDKPMRNQSKNEFSRIEEKLDDDNPRKVRKRTRAGSEPPFGRTEEVIKTQPQDSKLKRSQSDQDVDRGDPMTRVELPRRGSFLKPGNTRLPNNINGGTPLGFTELFDEFRNQEGLTSVDDILAAIIDPEGMSFNDLKPLYKEFLLKLAATLTQDELYQRSASIMRRRRRPQRRRSMRKPCLLGRAIKRSVSRLKGGPTEFTSVIFPARKLHDSFDSSSSCDARNNRKRVLASRLSRRRSSWKNTKSAIGQTTSEDSDTCRRLARGAGANRSSSGYVSCSECSYDSESCTCVSADKCYCSLSRRVPSDSAPNNTVVCSCDTDSCSDSNKCYCARKSVQPTILEQLRQRGIVPSESTLSRAGTPDRAKTSRTSRSHASSKSLEFLKIRPSPGRSSSDNLALDYELFSPGKKSQHSSVGSEKVLVVSARDPQGRLVYVGGTEREKKSFEKGANRTEAHHEALSIKKSAEIAAVFGPDSGHARRRNSSTSSVRSSVSLEAGLGYLP